MASAIRRDPVKAVKHLRGVAISQSKRRVDLPKSGMIAIASAHNPDKLRGPGLDFVLLDEAARMPPRAQKDSPQRRRSSASKVMLMHSKIKVGGRGDPLDSVEIHPSSPGPFSHKGRRGVL